MQKNPLKIKDFFLKNIFKALLLPTFLLVLLVGSVYYLQINTITEQQKKHLVQQFHSSIQSSIEDKTNDIDASLDNIETNLLGIQNTIERYYSNTQKQTTYKPFNFEKNERGFWFKPEEYTGSSIVFMPQATPNNEDFNDAYNLEKIDSILMPLVDRNQIVVAAWMNQENYLVSYYPLFDMKNILEPDANIKKFNFYYEADPQHNPDRQNIWTTPYLDPAMKGWLISRVAPIYNKNKFLGVIGIDINIDAIISGITKIYNSYEIRIFLTNNKGQILSMDDELKAYFDLIDLDTYKDGKSLSNEVVQPDSYNVLTSTNEILGIQLKKIFESNSFGKINHKDTGYFIYKSKIKNTHWVLFYMIEENKLLNELNEIQYENLKIALYALAFFILLFIVMVLNLKRNIQNSVQQISKPIEELSEATKNIEHFQLHDDKNISEISNLYKNFKIMAEEISEHHHELETKVQERTIELNEQIQTIEELQERLIEQNNHDHLTSLFNRRYGDEVFKRESQRVISESGILTIAMLDIDYFKKVNDNYGHQAGDEVLINLSTIIKKNVGTRDVAIRYGGEEFLLIFPGIDKHKAYTIVESIQKKFHLEILNKVNFEAGTTISAGIASFPADSKNIEELIKLADDALYESKNNGRNRITIYQEI
jgi:diguanylate cyclase (GGDEF)-like protein